MQREENRLKLSNPTGVALPIPIKEGANPTGIALPIPQGCSFPYLLRKGAIPINPTGVGLPIPLKEGPKEGAEFAYSLPRELIAQEPLEERDKSRLLVLDRKDKSLKEILFKNVANFINKGDVLVLNDTKVAPARILGKRKTGGRVEVLLLKEKERGLWEGLVKPSQKIRIGESILLGDGGFAGEFLDYNKGTRLIKFNPPDVSRLINKYGKVPLPPYIKKALDDPRRYQTVYAKKEGAVAAPTAGLHFTERLINELTEEGVNIVYITLHCGPPTFRPIKCQDIREHKMGQEFYEVTEEAAKVINEARLQERKIVAVGTTVVRTLETVGFINDSGISQVRAKTGQSELYIYPRLPRRGGQAGYEFKIVNSLITNFHLPCSTNLILVSAFAGIKFIHRAYRHAIDKRFRFYSFGDAMLIL